MVGRLFDVRHTRIPHHLITGAVCIVAALMSVACASQERRLDQQRKALHSLESTTRALADAWLAGHVSGTYTQTALERTFLLVEQERSALASSADMLIDPRGALLSDGADELARALAQLIRDVRSADAAAVRSHLAVLPSPTRSETP